MTLVIGTGCNVMRIGKQPESDINDWRGRGAINFFKDNEHESH
jgi:hypothetical protein